uniref:Uncharacterized protein n=1 Tax=Sphaerodactylus townsendi TaxID=933632 RepID=A0ACB8G134_9SAUR
MTPSPRGLHLSCKLREQALNGYYVAISSVLRTMFLNRVLTRRPLEGCCKALVERLQSIYGLSLREGSSVFDAIDLEVCSVLYASLNHVISTVRACGPGLTDLKVMDGSQVIMTVEVSANPAPEIIWLHNGKEIQETEDFHFEKKGNEYSLYIQEVFPEDTGTYTCEAWNDLGEARSQATLTVQGTLRF